MVKKTSPVKKLFVSYMLIFRWPFMFVLLVAIFEFTSVGIGLSLPCGGYIVHSLGGQPSHGVCQYHQLNNEPDGSFMSPAFVLVAPVVIALVLWPAFVWNEDPTNPRNQKYKSQFTHSISMSFRRIPKWKKKAFSFTLATVCVAAALVLFTLTRNAGFRWYNYVAQYAVLLPSIAWVPTLWLVNLWHKLKRRTKTR